MTDLAQNEARRSEQLRLLEQLCDEFESQWRSGQRPTLAEVLTKAPHELRGEAFRELLAIEVGYRRASGEQLSLSDYRQQFSEFEEAISQEFKVRPETHSVSQADEPTFIPSPSQPEISPISAASSDPAAVTQPERLDDYILLEELGHGGMGTVFKARHRKLKRIVALKVLPTDRMKDAAAVARFEREMEAVGTLDHPNIVRAFDAGEANGQHYLVMEYVRGADLSDVSAKVGRLKIADACEVVRQAALGLQSAHSHGMVHRDIKPSNLILTGGQPSQPATVKILDLGLALLSEQHSPSPKELTSTGQLMGTVDYMAPEQGIDTHSVDIRADIFSLGATLFKLLTGDVPLSGDKFNSPMKKLMALAMSQVPSISTKRPELPPGLVAIVDRMLAKEPAERFATPAEVAEALVPFARGHRLGALLTAATGDASYAELEPTDVASNDSASSPTLLASTADIAPADRELSETILAATQPLSATATRWSKLRIAISATSLAAFLVLGTIAYRVQTDRGTLVVEIDESAASQIETQLKDGGLVFHDKARKRTWVVKPRQPDQPQSGTLRVEPIDGLQLTVSDDSGVQLKTEEFTLNRNGKIIVRVSLAKTSNDTARLVSTNIVTSPPAPAVAPFDAKQAKAHQEAWAKHLGTAVESTNSVGAKMILIPPGEFLMGSTDEQVEAALKVADQININTDQPTKDRIQKSERPQHKVVITEPFLMSATEVTIGQFKKFTATGYITEAEKAEAAAKAAPPPVEAGQTPPKPIHTYLNPGYAVTDDSPAAVITWNDATAYCQWLSTQEKATYRLPTEAEWEYACRAGTTTQYSFGDDHNELPKYGWHNKNAGGKSHPVGTLLPNGFGLFDMHGNLYEWCGDVFDEKWYSTSPPNDPIGPSAGSNRVIRGGLWFNTTSHGRSASRHRGAPSYRTASHGFRCVSELDVPTVTASAATGTPSPPLVSPPPKPTPVGPQPPPAVAPFDAAKAKAHQEAWAKHLGMTVETVNSIGAKMILIPPGEFLMGSSDEQIAAALKAAEGIKAAKGVNFLNQMAERPQHNVVINQPFLVSATEVTIGQFRKFIEASGYATEAEQYGFGDSLGNGVDDKVTDAQKQKNWRTPGYAVTDDSPVVQITWNDAVAYCQWHSTQEKATYRLPTEAEWEYACRAGTTTQYSFGDDYAELGKFGCYNKNAGSRSQSVGTKLPNAFGLFDMHGNLYEWCGDFYHQNWYEKTSQSDPNGPLTGPRRVVRGGAWTYGASNCRSASRGFLWPSYRYNDTGFRVVRVLDARATTASATPQPPVPAVAPSVAKPVGPTPPLAKAPFDAAQAKVHQDAWAKHLGTTVETTNSVGAKMILIPPGEFLMGSNDEQIAAALQVADATQSADQATKDRIKIAERPQHRVVITKPFWMGATEMTVGQFKRFSASGYQTEAEKAVDQTQAATYLSPGYAVTDDSPAAVITWNDAVAYCNWLSTQEQQKPCYRLEGTRWLVVPGQSGYRLPTEAEWEYACRAGSTSQYSFGDDHRQLGQHAWHQMNADRRSHAVGTKPPNGFGLFDLHGNVQEWCQDFWDEAWYVSSPTDDPTGPVSRFNRVLRGGAWSANVSGCRAASRNNNVPTTR